MNEELLEVKGLHTSFFTHLGEVKAIRDVSFSVHKNEIVGIVGESGSGKSVTSLSIMGLLAHPGRVTGGQILFKGEDLTKVKKGRMRKIQGNQISMIFQDPMTSLNPLFTIGNQITEAILTHQKMTKAEAKKRAVEMLKLVGIPSPEKRYESFPHEFSGGMRQRVGIAMAMTFNPELLLADEPTSALDVTTQAQIVRQMMELRDDFHTSIIIVTHNIGVAAYMADQLIVMQHGKVVDQGTRDEVMNHPTSDYTKKLLAAVPEMEGRRFV